MNLQSTATKMNVEKELIESIPVSKSKISIIVTLKNHENDIEELYESLINFLERNERQFQILFVDDGSIDKTYDKLVKITERDLRVKLIRLRSSFGEASAFDAGIKHSFGDIIIYFTARVRIKSQDLSKLISKLEDGNDLVIGWRYPRRDAKLNQIISKVFNSITRKLSKLNLHDINSGVLVTKREVLENINVYGDLNNFIPILAARQGYKVTEEKIEQLRGEFRKSKYFKEYLKRILDIITVLFLTNYSKKPIHCLGFFGAIFTLFGAAIEIYLFIYRILALGPIAGRPLLLLGALFLVIGIQLISIGLLGEMIIFTHAKDIKEYNIEEIIEW